MNKNIEIIVPGKLAAVKFSYIPFISDIQYTPDSEVRAYSEPLRITDDGVFLLNKDHPSYESLKNVLVPMTRLSEKQLHRKHGKLAKTPNVDKITETYKLCMEAEMERRKKAQKGGGRLWHL